jgi:D-alanyl-D-alanine carboxypeptidase
MQARVVTPAAPVTADAARPAARAETRAEPAERAAPRPAVHERGGFLIQVGAFPSETQARTQLKLVQTKVPGLVADASPFTERVQRGNQELVRARFAGLDRAAAERACQTLQRSDIACMAMRAGG